MGQVLHGSATTTEVVRRAFQHTRSLRTLARRYGVNPKTIAKWKARTSAADLPTGPKTPSRSTILSVEEEAAVVAFRKHTHLETLTSIHHFSGDGDDVFGRWIG